MITPWIALALLACSSPEPTAETTEPSPSTVTGPAPSEPDAPARQALGSFWPSLQVLPAGPASPPTPGSVPAALGCITTGQHAAVVPLPTDDAEPWRPALSALVALLAGDPTGATSLEQTTAGVPQHPLVRVAQGHAAIAAGAQDQGSALLAPVVSELAPQLGDAAPLEPISPPGPCGVSVEPAGFAWWLAELGLAWAAANSGDHLLALDHHQAILALRPGDRMASLGAGLALMNLDRVEEAMTLVQPLATAWPDDPLVAAELEVLIARQRQDAEAEASWARELARGDEPSTCPYEGLGLSYLAQGRTEEAREQLERSIEVDPALGFRKYNGLARILLDEGDLVQARAMLETSLANHPGNAEALDLMVALERMEASIATP
jgi:tetratricopeptide (TPR) repeat protein